MMETRSRRDQRLEYLERWKLAGEVDHLRERIIKRSRSLADDLTRLASGLEADPEYSFNTLGELQGNGVELDTWCARLGFAREVLRELRAALAEEETNAG
jgi:hypothetical protein